MTRQRPAAAVAGSPERSGGRPGRLAAAPVGALGRAVGRLQVGFAVRLARLRDRAADARAVAALPLAAVACDAVAVGQAGDVLRAQQRELGRR